ncbi:27827_t:CDS:2, partial [Gigaspora margarita]
LELIGEYEDETLHSQGRWSGIDIGTNLKGVQNKNREEQYGYVGLEGLDKDITYDHRNSVTMQISRFYIIPNEIGFEECYLLAGFLGG